MTRTTTSLILITIFCVFVPGCRLTGQVPVRTEETAIIACEAAHITIQAVPSEREENVNSSGNDIP